MSDILFKCPQCSKHLAVDEAAKGGVAKCVDCGHPVTVPVDVYAANCPACAWEVAVPPGLAGVTFQCPNCGEELDVPAPNRGTVPDLLFRCPHCSKGMAVHRETAGKTVACVGCGHSVVVPKPEVTFACLSCTLNLSAPGQAAGEAFKCPSCGAKCEVPDHSKAFTMGASKPCPGCGRPVARDAAVCLICGVDLRTGKPKLRLKKDAAAGTGEMPAGTTTTPAVKRSYQPTRATTDEGLREAKEALLRVRGRSSPGGASVGVSEKASAARRQRPCPSCGGGVAPNAVLCGHCGANLLQAAGGGRGSGDDAEPSCKGAGWFLGVVIGAFLIFLAVCWYNIAAGERDAKAKAAKEDAEKAEAQRVEQQRWNSLSEEQKQAELERQQIEDGYRILGDGDVERGKEWIRDAQRPAIRVRIVQ